MPQAVEGGTDDHGAMIRGGTRGTGHEAAWTQVQPIRPPGGPIGRRAFLSRGSRRSAPPSEATRRLTGGTAR